MGKVASYYNVGDRENLTVEKLLEIIEDMYADLAEAVNGKPDLYERTTDGQATDTFLSQGAININSTTNKVQILAAHTGPSSVTWVTLG